MKNSAHTKIVGASPIPATGTQTAARPGIQREKTVDGTGRKVATVGEAAERVPALKRA